MNYLTLKQDIVSVLGSYTEIPENKLPENSSMAHNHLSYSLKMTGIDTINLSTSGGVTFSYKMDLMLKYTNINSSTRDENSILFIDVIKSLAGLPQFGNFTENPTFTDLDEKHSQGKIEFLYGIESC